MLIESLFNIALLGAVVAADTPPIVVKGNAFFNSETNKRFYIRGLAYQPGGSSKLEDPLADPATCARDVPLFKELGINTIRVYSVDNTKDHSECMELLSENGIYLLLDVSTPLSSIARDSPACSYNSRYLRHVFATVDEFARYDNVLGFFAGNEVINDVGSTNAAPYVKAVVRDMKKYLRARDYRQIPVGYSAADVTENRVPTAHYFNCGDEDERIDMFGINDYSYCGKSYQASGYGIKMKEFANYSIPVFLSEYGCNTGGSERHFNEVSSIYSRTMSSVFSGGIVYEYSNEANNYGLVNIIDKDTVEKLPDFDNLKEQFSETSDPEGDAGYSENLKYSVCPTNSTKAWIVRDKVPPMPEGAKKYFTHGAGNGKGMKYSTQNSCGLEDVEEDDDDVPVESSTSTSETSTSETTTIATTMSTSTSTSTSTEEATSHSVSSSSRTSRSSDAAGTLEVPTVVKLLYHIIFSLL